MPMTSGGAGKEKNLADRSVGNAATVQF